MAWTVWFLFAVKLPSASAQPAIPSTEITITSQVIKRVDPALFLGLNWTIDFHKHALREIFRDRRLEFAQFLKATGVRCLRYPGGIHSEWHFYEVPSFEWYPQYAKHVRISHGRPDDWIELPEFLDFLNEGGFRGIIQLNVRQYWDSKSKQVLPVKSPQGLAVDRVVERAARVAKLLNTIPGDRYIEIGNEDWGYCTAEDYAAIAYNTMAAIKRIAPEIKIIITGQSYSGPNFKGNTTLLRWTEKMLRSLAEKGAQKWVDYVSHHDYANVLEAGPGPAPSNMSTSTTAEEWQRYMAYDSTTDQGWQNFIKMFPVGVLSDKSPVTLLDELLKKYGYQHTKILVTEFRNGWLTNRFSKAFTGGMGTLNLLIHYLKSPEIAGAAIHSLMHVNRVSQADKWPFQLWGFGIVEYAPYLEQKFIATPPLQALSLLSHVLQGNEVLQTNSSDSQLSLVCLRKGNNYYLLVVNRDLQGPHQAFLRFPQWGDSWTAKGQSLLWTSKSIGDYAVVYGSFDQVTPIPIAESSFVASPSSVISFPAHSATVLAFQVVSK